MSGDGVQYFLDALRRDINIYSLVCFTFYFVDK